MSTGTRGDTSIPSRCPSAPTDNLSPYRQSLPVQRHQLPGPCSNDQPRSTSPARLLYQHRWPHHTSFPTRLRGPSHRSHAPPRMQKPEEGEGKRKGPRLSAVESMQDPAIPLKPKGAVPLACSQRDQRSSHRQIIKRSYHCGAK